MPRERCGNVKSAAITSEIFQVGGSGFTSAEDAAIYLIRVHAHAALVDAGCGRNSEKLFRNIQSHGTGLSDIERLLITHCHYDHTGGIQAVREETNCQVVMHELDAVFLEEGNESVTGAAWYSGSLKPVPVDIKLAGGLTTIELGARKIDAFHVPGHSPGSLVYLMESEGLKVLFGQDVHGPIHPSLLSNRGDYIRSLNLMISLQADILCEGHYGIFRGKTEVADFIESFL
jgi:glyoxylase-like metal-dependent hydrolase (beta-lactamase superfamily II)